MTEEISELLWCQVKNVLYITKEQYLQAFDGWSIQRLDVAGELVCVVLTNGPELHFATFGKNWSIKRDDIRRYVNPLLEKYGCVKTKTPREATRQHRFNKLIGFSQCGEDEFFIHYQLERLRHA